MTLAAAARKLTAMELTGRYVVAPLAVGSLLTGCVIGLTTRWACSAITGR